MCWCDLNSITKCIRTSKQFNNLKKSVFLKKKRLYGINLLKHNSDLYIYKPVIVKLVIKKNTYTLICLVIGIYQIFFWKSVAYICNRKQLQSYSKLCWKHFY